MDAAVGIVGVRVAAATRGNGNFTGIGFREKQGLCGTSEIRLTPESCPRFLNGVGPVSDLIRATRGLIIEAKSIGDTGSSSLLAGATEPKTLQIPAALFRTDVAIEADEEAARAESDGAESDQEDSPVAGSESDASESESFEPESPSATPVSTITPAQDAFKKAYAIVKEKAEKSPRGSESLLLRNFSVEVPGAAEPQYFLNQHIYASLASTIEDASVCASRSWNCCIRPTAATAVPAAPVEPPAKRSSAAVPAAREASEESDDSDAEDLNGRAGSGDSPPFEINTDSESDTAVAPVEEPEAAVVAAATEAEDAAVDHPAPPEETDWPVFVAAPAETRRRFVAEPIEPETMLQTVSQNTLATALIAAAGLAGTFWVSRSISTGESNIFGYNYGAGGNLENQFESATRQIQSAIDISAATALAERTDVISDITRINAQHAVIRNTVFPLATALRNATGIPGSGSVIVYEDPTGLFVNPATRRVYDTTQLPEIPSFALPSETLGSLAAVTTDITATTGYRALIAGPTTAGAVSFFVTRMLLDRNIPSLKRLSAHPNKFVRLAANLGRDVVPSIISTGIAAAALAGSLEGIFTSASPSVVGADAVQFLEAEHSKSQVYLDLGRDGEITESAADDRVTSRITALAPAGADIIGADSGRFYTASLTTTQLLSTSAEMRALIDPSAFGTPRNISDFSAPDFSGVASLTVSSAPYVSEQVVVTLLALTVLLMLFSRFVNI